MQHHHRQPVHLFFFLDSFRLICELASSLSSLLPSLHQPRFSLLCAVHHCQLWRLLAALPSLRRAASQSPSDLALPTNTGPLHQPRTLRASLWLDSAIFFFVQDVSNTANYLLLSASQGTSAFPFVVLPIPFHFTLSNILALPLLHPAIVPLSSCPPAAASSPACSSKCAASTAPGRACSAGARGSRRPRTLKRAH